ncbi:four helix bundle protein [Pleurocapsa sp. FMAR1]|uniref:four helix bundle protein n=1 Tax=Pleurocapsa sp. FMAR1 TaxID=3040204 RepID=UPI0029C8AF20|nr:four helix bundle protein [Pleurocapsa sp. FMAR1]
MQQNKPRFISNHEDLEVYKIAFDAAMEIFKLSKNFPKGEKYSLIDQIRRSSRSVCANLAEAWTKGLPACRRRYKGSFLSKLNDAEAEAAETQVWLKFAVKCQYLDLDKGRELYSQYNQILGLIVVMTNSADKWLLKKN